MFSFLTLQVPLALVLAVYLWAGFWLAAPFTREARGLPGIKRPLWGNIIGFILLVLVWCVLFPIIVVKREQQLAELTKEIDK